MTDSTHDPYHDVMEDYAGGPVVGNDGNFLADADDDDAQILDSLVDQHAEPPSGADLPVVRIDMRPIPKDPTPARTVLRTRGAFLPLKEPFMLLAASPWRSRLVLGMNKNGFFRVANDRTLIQSLSTSYRASLGSTGTIELKHNGELWLYAEVEDMYVSVFEEVIEEVGR